MNPKLRILIVDDNRRVACTLADILSILGYAPVEAYSGAEALEKVRLQVFDCVLTDVKMPGLDGLELYRQLRQVRPATGNTTLAEAIRNIAKDCRHR